MKKSIAYLNAPVSIAPLAMFRLIFGFMMLLGIFRFAYKGWINDLYVKPVYYFTYYGFEWVKPLGETGMHMLFMIMALAAFGIMIGLFYRISAITFFILFTYVELIDKTNYLNHYYFVSLVSFLLIFLPAHRFFSVDVMFNQSIKLDLVPRWMVGSIRLQLGIVYFFAGIAKINPDWLFEAQPLRIWLPAKAHLPFIGPVLDKVWLAYFFSWFGCIYDLTIPFFLLMKKTRIWAYMAVILFHVLTGLLFNIGMFPYIMILSTLVFFPSEWHEKWIRKIRKGISMNEMSFPKTIYPAKGKLMAGIFLLFFVVQILVPFRYVLYPGKLFWTEEGFRFSWRVMLMEKGGTAVFTVGDPTFPGTIEINNRKYLTPVQEKMMSTQPDMILQFAHFLRDRYAGKSITIRDTTFTFTEPIVKVKSYVSLNGSGSQPFIDPEVDLAKEEYNLKHRKWVLDFE